MIQNSPSWCYRPEYQQAPKLSGHSSKPRITRMVADLKAYCFLIGADPHKSAANGRESSRLRSRILERLPSAEPRRPSPVKIEAAQLSGDVHCFPDEIET